MKTNRINILAALLVFGPMSISSVNAAPLNYDEEWQFAYQACSSLACNTADPSIASLFLEDTSDGVVFTLEPTWNYLGTGNPNSVESLNIVFTDNTPGIDISLAFVHLDGVESSDVSVWGTNMDSGYNSSATSLRFKWGSEGGETFGPNATSSWRINDTTIDLNFAALATHNANNPSPTFGIISVTGSGRPVGDPPSSNWVTGPSPVPVPAAAWLFGTALIGFVGMSRRRKLS